MADGEINRNGATIRIDDDGGVQVEPAEGQEVEYTGPDRGTDAIRDSVNTDAVAGGVTSTTINDFEGPGIRTTADNKLESDLGPWQDVSGSREFNTQEENTTGNPLVVAASAVVDSADASADDDLTLFANADGTRIISDSNQTSDGSLSLRVSQIIIVPNGATYEIELFGQTDNASIQFWYEAEFGDS